MVLPGLALLLLLLSHGALGQLQGPFSVVSTAAQLRLALLNTNLSNIVCSGTLVADSAAWPSPLTLSRTLRLASARPKSCVLVYTAQSDMLVLNSLGSLQLTDLTLVYTQQQGSSPPSTGPLPGIQSSAGTLMVGSVTLYTPGTELSLLSTFWSQPSLGALGLVNAVTRVASNTTTGSCPGACRLPAYQSPRELITNLVVLAAKFDADCYTDGPIAYDSSSLRQALESGATSVHVYQDLLLSPLDFNYSNHLNITWGTRVYACSGTQLDLNYNYTRAALRLGGGGQLSFRNIVLHNSQASSRLFWPSFHPALVSLFEVLPGGSVLLEDVRVSYGTVEAEVATLTQHMELHVLSGVNKPSFTINSSTEVTIHQWRLDRSVWPPTPAQLDPADAYWQFTNVLVVFAPAPGCFQGPPGIRVQSGLQLRQLLLDPLISRIEVINNITFIEAEWPSIPMGGASGPAGSLLNVSHSVEIRACHPQPGGMYTIDFSDLGQVVFVFGTMVWRGNMIMVNPRASPRRAWLYLLIGALSVETDGVIHFEDVEIQGNTTSAFHNALDPFWQTTCLNLCKGLIPERSSFLNASYYDAFIYSYYFSKTDWVYISQSRNVTGAGFWSYRNVRLIWRPYKNAAIGPGDDGDNGVPIAAIVVPVVVGGMLLMAATAAAVYFLYYKPRRSAAYAATFKAGDVQVSSSQENGPMAPAGGTQPKDPLSSQVDSMIKSSVNTATEARIEDMRRHLAGTSAASTRCDQIQLCELLGEGTFGKVYRGYWRGTLVAVKAMVFPANMSGKEKREKMAVMETAISASLSHPNIVQTYTYAIQPVKSEGQLKTVDGQSFTVEGHSAAFLNNSDSHVHSWEVRLVLEFCDKGSLRDALDAGVFLMPAAATAPVPEAAAAAAAAALPEGGTAAPTSSTASLAKPIHYTHVVQTALDVARAMLHLHAENIIHSDLKARNVLLKSNGSGQRGFTAKVADFGLSVRIDPGDTHISNVFQGTITHMAPETLIQGKISKSTDVYAYGILMWELYTGGHAYKGVPRALLGHDITKLNKRPEFPPGTPFEYQLLACRCWESDASIRPSFTQILEELTRIETKLGLAKSTSQSFNKVSASTVGSTSEDSIKATDPKGGLALPVHDHTEGSTKEWSATADSMDGYVDAAGGRRLPFMQPIVEEGGTTGAMPSGGGLGAAGATGSTLGLTELKAIEGVKFADLSTMAADIHST